MSEPYYECGEWKMPAYYVGRSLRPTFNPFEMLFERAAEITGLTVKELKTGHGKSVIRTDMVPEGVNIGHARFGIMWVMRERVGWSYARLGREFNHCDHTTVRHGVKLANHLRETNFAFYAYTNDLLQLRRT